MNAESRTGPRIVSDVIRSGIDNDVAVRSALAAHPQEKASEPSTRVGGPQSIQASGTNQTSTAPPSVKRRILTGGPRALLRRTVRLMFLLAKPIVRPVASRARTYFIAEIRAELARTSSELRMTSSEIRTQMALDLNHVHHELRQLEVRSQHRADSNSAALIQYLQWQTEIVRRDLTLTVESLRCDNREVAESLGNRFEEQIDHARNALYGALLEGIGTYLARIELYAGVSARRVVVPLSHGELLVRTESGYVLCPSSDLPLVAILAESGELELGTRLLIERFLRPGDVFVDVGANLGLHSLAAARTLLGQGRVIAFEPFPQTADFLTRSLALNGYSNLCDVHQVALSDEEGKRLLHLGVTSGHHSLFALDEGQTNEIKSVSVNVTCLDTVITVDTKVDLIKIDVEGAELAVLTGASGVLDRNPDVGIIIEFGPSHLRRSGTSTAEWLQLFRARDFQWRAIEPMTGSLEEWTEQQLENIESINLFFAREGSTAWDRVKA